MQRETLVALVLDDQYVIWSAVLRLSEDSYAPEALNDGRIVVSHGGRGADISVLFAVRVDGVGLAVGV